MLSWPKSSIVVACGELASRWISPPFVVIETLELMFISLPACAVSDALAVLRETEESKSISSSACKMTLPKTASSAVGDTFHGSAAGVSPNRISPNADPVFPSKSSALTRILVGSNSTVPLNPAGAVTSTLPSKLRLFFPDISTKPPSPPCSPPLAETWPKNPVTSFAQTITLPPSPSLIASALMSASAAT